MPSASMVTTWTGYWTQRTEQRRATAVWPNGLSVCQRSTDGVKQRAANGLQSTFTAGQSNPVNLETDAGAAGVFLGAVGLQRAQPVQRLNFSFFYIGKKDFISIQIIWSLIIKLFCCCIFFQFYCKLTVCNWESEYSWITLLNAVNKASMNGN